MSISADWLKSALMKDYLFDSCHKTVASILFPRYDAENEPFGLVQLSLGSLGIFSKNRKWIYVLFPTIA